MSGDTDIRRGLQRIQAPDELDARRAWSLARAAFEHREPLGWQRRNRGRSSRRPPRPRSSWLRSPRRAGRSSARYATRSRTRR